MKIKITRTQLRKLIESTTKEQNKRATLNESKLANITVDTDKGLGAPDHGDLEYLETLDDEEDVEELARYDALNDDVDATLYRDNPDYRRVFKATLREVEETTADYQIYMGEHEGWLPVGTTFEQAKAMNANSEYPDFSLKTPIEVENKHLKNPSFYFLDPYAAKLGGHCIFKACQTEEECETSWENSAINV